MGKRFWRKNSYLEVEKEDPGCLWTVFKLLNYHPWHNDVNNLKLLPYDDDNQKSHTKSTNSKVMSNEQLELKESSEFEEDAMSINSVSVKSSFSRNGSSRRKSWRGRMKTNEQHEFSESTQVEEDAISINSFSVNSSTSRNGFSKKKKSLRARMKALIAAHQGSKSSKVKSIQEHELLALQDQCEELSSPTLISLLKANPKLMRMASRADKSGNLSRTTSVKHKESKDDEYVGVLELFRVDKGLFLKIVEESPPRKHRLVKSGSFPFSNLSHKPAFGTSPSKVEDKHNEVWPTMNHGHELRKAKSQRVVRSSSLKDSLDRYGHFFDTTSSSTNKGFKKHLSKSLKLTNEKDFMLLSDQLGRRSFRERLHLPDYETEAPRASLENFLHNIGQGEVRVVRLDSFKETKRPQYIVESPDEFYMDVTTSNVGSVEQGEDIEHVEIVELTTDNNSETLERTSTVSGLEVCSQGNEPENLDWTISEGSLTKSHSTSTLFEISEDVQGLSELTVSLENNGMDNCDEELHYVRYVLEVIGFTTADDPFEAWHSPEQPLDPALFDGIEICCPYEPKPSSTKAMIMSSSGRKFVFDMINEALLDVHERSYAYYPKVLSSSCQIQPMPKGRNRVVEEVWEFVNQFLSWQPEHDEELNFAVAHDLSRHKSGWSNLQTETELLAIDLEDWIFSELLDEIVCC